MSRVTTVFMLSRQIFFVILLSLSCLFLPYTISHHLFIYSFISSIIYTLIFSFGAIYLLIHFHDHFLFVTIPYSSPPMCLFIFPFFPFTFSLLFISNFQTITSSSSIPHFLLLIPPSHFLLLIPPSHFPFFCYINLIVKIFSCFSSSLFPRQATCCLFFSFGSYIFFGAPGGAVG